MKAPGEQSLQREKEEEGERERRQIVKRRRRKERDREGSRGDWSPGCTAGDLRLEGRLSGGWLASQGSLSGLQTTGTVVTSTIPALAPK